VKIQTNQSNISASQNLMDFEIPEYIQGVDLNESFININYRIDTKEPAASSTVVGVHNFVKLFNGIGTKGPAATNYAGSDTLFNSSLIRNISLNASKVGQLESIQRADLINQVKQQYTKNLADIQGESGHSIRSLPEQLNYPMDQSRSLLTEGTTTSTERVGVMRVDLKDVLGLGNTTLNLSQLGSLRLHIEANFNKFYLKEVPTFNADTPKGVHAAYFEQDLNVAATQPAPTEVVLDVPGSNSQGFITKKNCPFWVGQKVTFVLTGATNAPNITTIAEMTWETMAATVAGEFYPDGVKLILKFANGDSVTDADGVIAGSPLTKIRVVPMYAEQPEITYIGAEMIVKTVAQPPQASGLRYRTFTTTQDFAPSSTANLSRTYEIAQNAIASLICFDTAQHATDFSNSYDQNVTSYQAYVDNVGMTDRPVNVRIALPKTKDPLHGIILEKTLEEMGLEYKNNLDVLPQQMKVDNGDILDSEVIVESGVYPETVTGSTGGVLVVPVMYEANGQSKLLNLDVVRDIAAPAAAVALNLVLFQQVERTINY
tara:strand:+ start:1360 stop:2994 length:1635 start_codon:yes stop_codon:yes gene_type:complete